MLKGRGVLKRGDSVRKGGCCWSGYFFSSWSVANGTAVTFNYILVAVFLFPLNVGVSRCFHCTVLVSVYRVYTYYFHNTVVSSLHVSEERGDEKRKGGADTPFHTMFCYSNILCFWIQDKS